MNHKVVNKVPVFGQRRAGVYLLSEIYNPDDVTSPVQNLNKVIPAIGSLVVDDTIGNHNTLYVVYSVDAITHRSTLVNANILDTSDGTNLSVSYGNENYMLFYSETPIDIYYRTNDSTCDPDKRYYVKDTTSTTYVEFTGITFEDNVVYYEKRVVYEMAIDGRLNVYTNNASTFTVFKSVSLGNINNATDIVSEFYISDENGDYIESSNIPLELFKTPITTEFGEQIAHPSYHPKVFYSSSLPEQNEKDVMIASDTRGALVASVVLSAQPMMGLQSLNMSRRVITRFDITANQYSNENGIYLLRGQNPDELIFYGDITYSDHDQDHNIAVDNTQLFMYGMEDVNTSIVGSEYDVLFKYFLPPLEQVSNASDRNYEIGMTKRYIYKTVKVRIIDNNFANVSKISPVFVYTNNTAGYSIIPVAYYSNMVEPDVVYYNPDEEGSVPSVLNFNGTALDTNQVVTLQYHNDNHISTDKYVVTLQNGNEVEKVWYYYRDRVTVDSIYYGKMPRPKLVHAQGDSGNNYTLFVSTDGVYTNEKDWFLKHYYFNACPPVPYGKTSMVTPTHFLVRQVNPSAYDTLSPLPTPLSVIPAVTSPISIDDYFASNNRVISTRVPLETSGVEGAQPATAIIEFLVKDDPSAQTYKTLYGVGVDVTIEDDGRDRERPTITITSIVPNPETTRTRGNVVVHATFRDNVALDPDTGKQYKLNNGQWQNYVDAEGITVTENSTTVTLKATDTSGNTSTTSTLINNIDRTAPNLILTQSSSTQDSATIAATVSNKNGYNYNVTIEYSTVAGDSDLSQNTTAYPSSGAVFNANGTYYFRASDGIGNSVIKSIEVTGINTTIGLTATRTLIYDNYAATLGATVRSGIDTNHVTFYFFGANKTASDSDVPSAIRSSFVEGKYANNQDINNPPEPIGMSDWLQLTGNVYISKNGKYWVKAVYSNNGNTITEYASVTVSDILVPVATVHHVTYYDANNSVVTDHAYKAEITYNVTGHKDGYEDTTTVSGNMISQTASTVVDTLWHNWETQSGRGIRIYTKYNNFGEVCARPNINKLSPGTPTYVITLAQNARSAVITATFTTDNNTDRSYNTTDQEYSLNGTTWSTYPQGGVTVYDNTTVYFRGKHDHTLSNGYRDVAYSTVAQATVTGINNELTISFTADTTTPRNTDLPVTINYDSAATTKQYKIGNNGSWQNYTGSFNVPSNCTVYAQCSDGLGHTGSNSLLINNIDKAAPTITNKRSVPAQGTYTASTVKVYADFSDDVALASRQYKAGGSSWSTYPSTGYVEVSNNVVVEFKATDTAGNTVTDSFIVENIDVEGPTLVDIVGGDTTWYNTDREVIASYRDNQSGVSKIYYQIDNGSWQEASNTQGDGMPNLNARITISTSGNHSIKFKAEDNLGNMSSESTAVTVKIDKNPPTITNIQGTPPNSTTVVTGNVTVTATFSDDLSGVKSGTPGGKWYRVKYDDESSFGQYQEYTNVGVEMTKNGVVEFRAEDNAGNTTSEYNYEVTNIDRVVIDDPEVSADTSSWAKTVTLTADYGNATVHQYKVGAGGAWQTYDDNDGVSVTANGIYYFRGSDGAGHYSTAVSYTVNNIDRTAPTRSRYNIDTTHVSDTNPYVTVYVTYEDTQSGLHQVWYRISTDDGATYGSCYMYNSSAGIQVTQNCKIQFRADDMLGNISEANDSTSGYIVVVNSFTPVDPGDETEPDPHPDEEQED